MVLSVLSRISKVLERLIHDRLGNHFDKNDILRPHQYGFCAGRSTTLALISFIKDVPLNLEQHQPAAGVFCDFWIFC